MISAQKLAQFRGDRAPISGFWKIGDAEAHGNLLWKDDNAVLILSIELQNDHYVDIDDIDHPVFKFSKPPLQPTISGQNHKYNTITLRNCFRTNVNVSTKVATGHSAYELEFHITQIWIGEALEDLEGHVRQITLSDERVAGIFGNPGLETYESYQDEYKDVFAALGNPRTIWTVSGPNVRDIDLGDTGLKLSILTGALTGSSAQTGRSINSTVQLFIESDKDISIDYAIQQIYSFEQIISIFCLEAFTFKYLMLETGNYSGSGLAWQIDESDVFQSPMRHQILVDLSSPEVLTKICQQWFSASETVQLSRWLFSRALAETKSGLSRFVTVSQAFEVLGREYGPSSKMPRSRMQEAAKLIREVLSGKFEDKLVERWANLILSSNKASYKDILQHMI